MTDIVFQKFLLVLQNHALLKLEEIKVRSIII